VRNKKWEDGKWTANLNKAFTYLQIHFSERNQDKIHIKTAIFTEQKDVQRTIIGDHTKWTFDTTAPFKTLG